jgi:hypothetical protein
MEGEDRHWNLAGHAVERSLVQPLVRNDAEISKSWEHIRAAAEVKGEFNVW